MAMILVTAASSCSEDGGGAGTSSGGGDAGSVATPDSYTPPVAEVSPPADTSPLGEVVECPNGNYPTLVTVPANLAALVGACTNADGDLLLTNTSPLMLQVQAPDGVTSVDNPTRASDDLRSIVNAELAADSSSATAVVIPPGGYTLAYAEGQPAAVEVGITVFDASTSYAADILGRYISDRLSTPSQKIGKSAASCAKQTAELWDVLPPAGGTDLEQLLAETALGPAFECRKLFKEVAEEANGKPPSNKSVLSQEFTTLGKSVKASVWDDLVGLGRKAVQLR